MAYDDIEQIKQLKARYFRLMDTKQWDIWADCFTEDLVSIVELEVPQDGKPVPTHPMGDGRDAFVASASTFPGPYTTVHHGHMPEITLTGPDTAKGIWAMEDVVNMPDGQVLYGYGHYHEDYRKEGGTWRIAKLHLTRLRLDYRRY